MAIFPASIVSIVLLDRRRRRRRRRVDDNPHPEFRKNFSLAAIEVAIKS